MMPAPKRRRITKWNKLSVNCDADPGVVTFIDGTKSEFDRGETVEVSESDNYRVHTDTGKPMSVCYQYILFLHPSMNHLDSKTVRSLYSSIELWSFDERNYMFKSPLKFDSMAMDMRKSVLGFLSPRDFANIKGVHKSSMDVPHLKGPKNCEQATVDLMDPRLGEKIFQLKKECIAKDLVRDLGTRRVVDEWHRGGIMANVPMVGKIRKIVATGPLAGEYPSKYLYGRIPGIWHLTELADLTHLLDIPSVLLEILCYKVRDHPDFLRGQVHVQEVLWNAFGAHEFGLLDGGVIDNINNGHLLIDRWVIPFKVEDAANVRASITELASLTPDIPIYTIIDPRDTEKVRLAQELGIKNYIVDEAYRGAPVLGILDNAQDIKFRHLYQEAQADRDDRGDQVVRDNRDDQPVIDWDPPN